MKNIDKAVWHAKMSNRWARLIRNARAPCLTLSVAIKSIAACIACLPTISNKHTARP